MSELERKYQRQRARLVGLLREKGITDERVLEAVGAVPRHLFVDPAFYHRAYKDEALPIGMNQTISQPYTVAYQTMLLDPKPGDRVLEIGTGSGYQAAVLCEMGVRLFTIERHRPLLQRAEAILQKAGYRFMSKCADGTSGWAAFAPFDGIIVTAGATRVPEELLEQLREPDQDHPGGRLIIPVGTNESQTMVRFTRVGPDEYQQEETHRFRFVPLVRDANDL